MPKHPALCGDLSAAGGGCGYLWSKRAGNMKRRLAEVVSGAREASVAGMLMLSVIALTGCAQVNMKRFSCATRIDLILNPGWYEFEEPFESQIARLRQPRNATCTDPQAIRQVYDILVRYEERWSNYWAVPPQSPPVVLIFHDHRQWLGTLDVYASALGHVHNLIRRIEPADAAEILRILCDCAGPCPQPAAQPSG